MIGIHHQITHHSVWDVVPQPTTLIRVRELTPLLFGGGGAALRRGCSLATAEGRAASRRLFNYGGALRAAVLIVGAEVDPPPPGGSSSPWSRFGTIPHNYLAAYDFIGDPLGA